ncbi:GEVED domain-containing protein [Profundibacterium mesophilum]|uniref:GEVED domain-containing protein n=1 Tax=Profundibacterium mesophilum KAUST100406-0324 TaxID=1037889 RepID=A0A921NQH5_9RHOB|nr:GEVED domain-containing protein [Profundibacterium mesophilum]KAF0676941.1 hypothetical protein PMES_00738 [Profundibacterium mesophilum KAUST100406-0324]
MLVLSPGLPAPLVLAIVSTLAILTFVSPRSSHAQDCGAACVLAGPRLASVDSTRSALLDPVLSGLLGSDVALDVLDWNGLAEGDVNLLDLLGESGARIGVSEPSQVLSAQMTLLSLVSAAGAVAAADGDTALVSALDALELPLAGLAGTIRLGDLLSIELPEGSLADIELNALDLVTGAVQLYNHRNVLTTTSPIALDNALLRTLGIGGGEILLQVVEPPVLRCGPTGTQFHSAAIRAHVALDLADLAVDAGPLTAALTPLLGAASAGIELARLDLYLEVARAEGAIRGIDLGARAVDLELSPAIGDLYLGAIDPAVFFNRDRALGASDLTHGQLGALEIALSGGLLRERARIHARALARGSPAARQLLRLLAPFPARGSVAQGTASLGHLATSLATSLDIEVEETLGLALDPLVDTVIEPAVNDVVGGVLGGTVTPALAQTVDPLLELLGVRVGEAVAEVRAITSRCRDTGDCPITGPAPDGVNTARYGVATHGIFAGMGIGALDPDDDRTRTGAGDAEAQADDLAGTDDEDGLSGAVWHRGGRVELPLALRGGAPGHLQGWVDWQGNGVFDPGDRIALDVTPDAEGFATLTVDVPADAREGTTFARLRWSSQQALGPAGPAPDGEVEDHAITIAAPAQIRLSGRVFADDGAGADAVAHDGIRQPGELALNGVELRALTPDGTELARGPSDAAGRWQLIVPAEAERELVMQALAPRGWRSISEVPDLPPQVLVGPVDDGLMVLAVAPGDSLTGLDLGFVPRAVLSAVNRDVLVDPGQRRDLPYRLRAGSPVSSELALLSPAATPDGALSVTLMRDADCDGTGDDALDAPILLSAGETGCAVARVAALSGAPVGSVLRYDLVATSLYAGTSTSESIRVPTTVTIGSALAIRETVENLSRKTAEGISNRAGPGDLLIYRLKLENTSSEPLDDVGILVATPVFTALTTPLPDDATRAAAPACELIAPRAPRTGFRGLLRWRCPGSMMPGERIDLSYVVRVLE